MPEGRARVTAELAGASQVVQGLKSIGSSVAGLASQALAATGVLQGINLSRAVTEAKNLDLATARLSQTAGRSSADIKRQFAGMERSLLTPAPVLASITKQIGRMTYDTQYGMRSLEGLGDAALATGRDLEEMPGLAAALKASGAKDVTSELGRLRDMADRLGTVGGPAALYDTITALGPQLGHVAAESDKARGRLEALVAGAGKGRSPAQQQQVAGGLLEVLRSRAMDLERVTGKRQVDEQGRLLDPVAMARELQQRALKVNAGNKAAARRGLINAYGLDVGSFLASADFNEIEKTAQQAKDTGANRSDANRFRQTAEGRRIDQEIQRNAAERKAGEQILPFSDAAADFLGPWGMLGLSAAGSVGSGLLGMVLGKAGGAGAASVAGGAATKVAAALGSKGMAGTVSALLGEGGAGANAVVNAGLLDGTLKAGAAATAAPVAAVLGTAAAQVYAVSQLGQDRDQMGQEWRSTHAQTIGQEIARQAQQQGDLMPVIGKAGGDQATITAALLALEKVMDRLPDRLADQVSQGMQAQLGRTPIYARVQRNPSDQAVN